MRYYGRDKDRRKTGPYTEQELRILYRAGRLDLDSELIPEDGFETVLLRDLNLDLDKDPEPQVPDDDSEEPPVIDDPAIEPDTSATLGERAGADLKVLLPHLMVPLEELRGGRWMENRTFWLIAAFGLMPLLIVMLLGSEQRITSAYWAIAFYFSGIWGIFFYQVFPAPGVKLSRAVTCFFATGILSMAFLLLLYLLPPFSILKTMAESSNVFLRLAGYALGVGIPEEGCKTLVLFFLVLRLGPLPPQTMLFYGLMSGLGFGIYEGVGYQTGLNRELAGGDSEIYYLLNLIRLTTLPFLHAIWTGMAGYFIGFAFQYPQRKVGLLIVAIGLPAILHGIYNTFNTNFISFLAALMSVLALYLYLGKSADFDKAFRK